MSSLQAGGRVRFHFSPSQDAELSDIFEVHVLPHLCVQDVLHMGRSCKFMHTLVHTACTANTWVKLATRSCPAGHPLLSIPGNQVLGELERMDAIHAALFSGEALPAAKHLNLWQGPDSKSHCLSISPSGAWALAHTRNNNISLLRVEFTRQLGSPRCRDMYRAHVLDLDLSMRSTLDVQTAWAGEQPLAVVGYAQHRCEVQQAAGQLDQPSRVQVLVINAARQSMHVVATEPHLEAYRGDSTLGGMVLSPCGKLLVVTWHRRATGARSTDLYKSVPDDKHWQLAASMEFARHPGMHCLFSPDGQHLAIAEAAQVHVHASSGAVEATLSASNALAGTVVEHMAFNQASTHLAVWYLGPPSISIYQASNWTPCMSIPYEELTHFSRLYVPGFGGSRPVHACFAHTRTWQEYLALCKIRAFRLAGTLVPTDVPDRLTKRLADACRQHEAAFSPEGSFIAYVVWKFQRSRMQLHVVDTCTQEVVLMRKISWPKGVIVEQRQGIGSKVTWLKGGACIQVALSLATPGAPTIVQLNQFELTAP